MNQVGYVTSVKGNAANVMFKRMSGCGDNCASCGGSCEVPPMLLEVENTASAKPGDSVEVLMEDNTFFKFTFFAYVLPLIFMLTGIGVGHVFFKDDLISIFMGFGFLAVSYGILRLVNNHHVKNNKPSVSMIKILSEEELARIELLRKQESF
ncbi:SoxR reducing system RseC family protein [Clostridium peptidivorans]|uniref:SoxR reducing system RseC family protein n=1 Tax=Clostridium peptidivorans TaxID=100174 RepID=UPI0015CA2A35|nr:SoxR reducing system RseC family protein [Clostridium peptidivorans]